MQFAGVNMRTSVKGLLECLSRIPRLWTLLLAVILAALVGVFDYATGFDLHVTPFYLLPVCWASWAVGRKAGLFLAAICAVLFAAASLMTSHVGMPIVIHLWNTLMLLAIFIGTVYAVTEAVNGYRSVAEAQARLREANERLEETVQLRTSALRSEIAERQRQEQAKLQAERLLERQEKLATLGTLTAGLAHEIRNPLTSLKARLYMLEKHLQTVPAARNDTDVIGAEISRLERIVKDVLSFARPADPKLEPLLVDALLSEVSELMSPSLESRGVRLVVESKSGLRIRGDSGHLKQALVNLVRNAAEAIDRGGTITLRARAARASLGGQETDAVILEVADDGKGIPPEVEKRLFDPFFSTKEAGTGLGLPIAARIVEKHGGIMQYDTKLGHGTTFGIVLRREFSDPGESADGPSPPL